MLNIVYKHLSFTVYCISYVQFVCYNIIIACVIYYFSTKKTWQSSVEEVCVVMVSACLLVHTYVPSLTLYAVLVYSYYVCVNYRKGMSSNH